MGQAKTGELKRAARQCGRRDRASTAGRLGVQVRAVRDRGITPGEAGGLLAARPGWLIAERRQAQTVREARQLAGELSADRVRVRIGRERDAAFEAARYRASQLLRRAGNGGG